MKKLFALVLITVLLLSVFAGCKKAESATAPTADTTVTDVTETPPPKPTRPASVVEAEAIIGAWKYTMDISSVMNVSVQQDGTFNDAMSDVMLKMYDGLAITMVLDLKEDKTFTFSTDEASLQEMTKTLEARIPELLPELLAVGSGMTLEELEAGLASSGMTMDDLIAQVGAQFNADSLVRSFRSEIAKGTYTYSEGELVLSNSDGKNVVYTVELDGDELTVTDISGSAGMAEQLPIVFVR